MRLHRLTTALCALALGASLAACGDTLDVGDNPTAASVETTMFAPALGIDLSAPGWTRNASGLYYRTLSVPTAPSATAANGQNVSVRYAGYLSNGVPFESSVYGFTLGTGNAIAGWHQGIVGMRVGERRRLLIPPLLGYGFRANGPIPGNSVLVFDVELLSTT